ncbi:hypothetical protein [Ornithinimicrobium kibberense]|uniref:hypothetical protein n=1 Tax=Ornithinimicrobium kibberense TaxID=282060 RepID=UPI00360A537E
MRSVRRLRDVRSIVHLAQWHFLQHCSILQLEVERQGWVSAVGPGLLPRPPRGEPVMHDACLDWTQIGRVHDDPGDVGTDASGCD